MEKAVVVVTDKTSIQEVAAGSSREATADSGADDFVAKKAVGVGKITVALN